ncbi:MAG: pgdA 6 [Clostridiales bacterium]|jgi:polysaccharide deacetylase family protein (PEP-CTERM system associated)|nr:pgdA 6 [Clostridiales bacterium]
MRNALTIDVEDWYMTDDFSIDTSNWDQYEDRIEKSTRGILELLKANKVRATFFVLGCVAQRHPGLIRDIANDGHEIGSHGGWHKMVSKMEKEEFRTDLLFSKHLLEAITGKECNMFRAPSWSISSDNFWVLEVLEEEGFICDSSIQPFKTPLSGINGSPLYPFHPVIRGRQLKLIEFPSTVLSMAPFMIPFAGGFYLRALPYFVVKNALRRVNKHREGMIYVHPWELDIDQPKLNFPRHLRMIHYLNLKTTREKLSSLIKEFDFVPLGEIIEDKKCSSHILR